MMIRWLLNSKSSQALFSPLVPRDPLDRIQLGTHFVQPLRELVGALEAAPNEPNVSNPENPPPPLALSLLPIESKASRPALPALLVADGCTGPGCLHVRKVLTQSGVSISQKCCFPHGSPVDVRYRLVYLLARKITTFIIAHRPDSIRQSMCDICFFHSWPEKSQHASSHIYSIVAIKNCAISDPAT